MQSVTRFVQKRVMVLLNALIAPKSTNEDSRRQEYILNIILATSIVIIGVFDATIPYNMAYMGKSYDGVPFGLMTGILLLFIALFRLSRIGRARLASYILIAIYIIGTIYCGCRWGASLPMTLLATALIIVLSSILIGTKCGLIISTIMVLLLFAFGLHEYTALGTQSWKYMTISGTDVIVYSGIFLFITILSWLSNREIENSLNRARKSEHDLKIERDNLEITVQKRTNEIQQLQLKQMLHLSRSAEFGKVAQGIFHDLINPLSAIHLGIERINQIDHPEINQIKDAVTKTVSASKRMGEFLSHARRSILFDAETSDADNHRAVVGEIKSIKDAIDHVLTVHGYRIRTNNIEISIDLGDVAGHTLKDSALQFERVIANLISNAIDADPKTIEINADIQNDILKLEIADDGCGIAEENLNEVFKPLFTTKSAEHGTGIGLTTVKSIVENIFHGQISIISKQNLGTIVTLAFPIK
jgi:signal transduction histidine kinase